MLAEPGGGGRPRQGRGRAGAGPPRSPPLFDRDPGSARGGGAEHGPAHQPCFPRRTGAESLERGPDERRGLAKPRPLSPTRVRLAQPKEGNERPEGLDDSGPAHLAPAYHRVPPPPGAGPSGGEAGPGAGPSRSAWRGHAPADSPRPGLISTRGSNRCNSYRSFHHRLGKAPSPARPPRPQLCSCLSPCLHPTTRRPTPGGHLFPGSSPRPLAPMPSGPPSLLAPGRLSFSERALRGARWTVGSPLV